MTLGNCGNFLSGFVRISEGNLMAVAGTYTMTKLKKGMCHSNSCSCCVGRAVHGGSPGIIKPFVVTDLRCRHLRGWFVPVGKAVFGKVLLVLFLNMKRATICSRRRRHGSALIIAHSKAKSCHGVRRTIRTIHTFVSCAIAVCVGGNACGRGLMVPS